MDKKKILLVALVLIPHRKSPGLRPGMNGDLFKEGGSLGLACIFFWRVIFLDEATVAADILKQWYPWKFYTSDFKTAHNEALF